MAENDKSEVPGAPASLKEGIVNEPAKSDFEFLESVMKPGGWEIHRVVVFRKSDGFMAELPIALVRDRANLPGAFDQIEKGARQYAALKENAVKAGKRSTN